MSDVRTRATTAKPRGRGLGWPIGIAIILAIGVAANIYMMRLAAGDPSFAVEPDYYRKAVHHDDVMAQRSRNAELGWTLEPEVASGAPGAATLRVRLADAEGDAISGATLSVEAFPIARSGDVVRATLVASAEGGDYAVELPVRHAGRWELRFDASRGGDRFTAVERVEILR
ncbi:MAG TPA: FixH family protein [Gemmatimonadales bacterium]